MNAFEDKVVIVTGGGAGIGRAAALKFTAQGARVLVTGRRIEPLQSLAAQHPNILFTIADAANPNDAERTIQEAIDRCGRLDVLVNNAGAGAILPLAEASAGRIDQIFRVNVFGPSLLARTALPHLQETRGSIVNVSSTFGHKAAPALSHYAASKAAVEHMTRCWALELAPDRVRVNAIAAGPAETDFLVERMGLSMEQAERVKANERIAFRSVAGATPTKLRDGSFRSHPRQRLGSPVRSSRSMAV
jgi:Short-chain dehydrogenases of various substrate specificities